MRKSLDPEPAALGLMVYCGRDKSLIDEVDDKALCCLETCSLAACSYGHGWKRYILEEEVKYADSIYSSTEHVQALAYK